MTEMMIGTRFMIDDMESVLYGIREKSRTKISDLNVIKRFIQNEKNTQFYLDQNLNSSMTETAGCIYVWLDTGIMDRSGNPIFISMIKGISGFVGHVVGTIRTLSESACSFFRLSRKVVSKKMEAFRNKYRTKADERIIKHIDDEQNYIIHSVNPMEEESEFAAKLRALELVFEKEVEEAILVDDCEKVEIEEEFSAVQKEITMELLLEKMDSMQLYMDELLQIIEKMENESQAKINELQEKNEEYRRAIVQMRTFVQEEERGRKQLSEQAENQLGHQLLGNHNKILVIGGQNLGAHIMSGIAKKYGFEKNDLEFVDYDKAKDFLERVRLSGRYSAIIYGACPHKTTGNAGYASSLERLQNTVGMPYTIDARNKSGKLKVTKESFRRALQDVCEQLMVPPAC